MITRRFLLGLLAAAALTLAGCPTATTSSSKESPAADGKPSTKGDDKTKDGPKKDDMGPVRPPPHDPGR